MIQTALRRPCARADSTPAPAWFQIGSGTLTGMALQIVYTHAGYMASVIGRAERADWSSERPMTADALIETLLEGEAARRLEVRDRECSVLGNSSGTRSD